MVRATGVPGSKVADNKTVDHVRPAYRAAQSIYTLFDDDVVPVPDAVSSHHLSAHPSPPCLACTNSTPCVFDVIADPLETKNLFGDPALPPGLVTNMSAKLASFAVYSPLKMTDAELGCYNCSATWGMFIGPQCERQDTLLPG